MNEFNRILTDILISKKSVLGSSISDKVKIKMLNHLADRCIRVATHLIPPDASEAALNRANLYDINLFTLREKDRDRIEAKIKKINPNDADKFKLEHLNPVNLIIQRMENNIYHSIPINLENEIVAVWVLKSEDDRLNSLGYRVNRPNPIQAYLDAGINIVKNNLGNNWLNQ